MKTVESRIQSISLALMVILFLSSPSIAGKGVITCCDTGIADGGDRSNDNVAQTGVWHHHVKYEDSKGAFF